MVSDSVQRLGAEVETLQHDVCAPRPVVISLRDEDVERVLACMSTRPVTTVMPEGDRLDQGHIDTDSTGDGCGDLSHLYGMGQPSPLVVGWKDHDLGLTGQPPERRGMHNAVAVTLE